MATIFNVRYASMRQGPRPDAPARTSPRAPASPARAETRGGARMLARVENRVEARVEDRAKNRVEAPRPTRTDGDAAPKAAGGFWGKDGFTFGDILDLINPLQHIPIVGAIYRAITGDDMAPGARILGDALYGGIAGLASGVVNAFVAETTGSDIGAHAIALLGGEGEGGDTPARVLAANTPPTPAATMVTATALAPATDGGAAPAATAATPIWLSYIPQAKMSPAALAARYASVGPDAIPNATPAMPRGGTPGADAAGHDGHGGGKAAAGILDAMARALDKYEAAGGLLPKNGAARKPVVDSLL